MPIFTKSCVYGQNSEELNNLIDIRTRKIMHTNENIATFQAFFDEGKQLRKKGKLIEAIEKYSQALQANPDSLITLNQLAGIYEARKEFDKALSHYQILVDQQPTKGMAYANLARMMMKQGHIQDSIRTHKKALTILPRQPDRIYKILYKQLGEALKQNGQVSEVIAVYQELLNEKKAEVFHSVLGKIIIQLSVKQGKLDEAVTYFQQACENQSANPWHYYHLGQALVKQNKHDEALNCYRKAILIKSEFSHLVYIALGSLLIQKGKPNEVFFLIIKALKIKSNYPLTYKLLKLYFHRFGSRLSPGDLEEQRKAYLDIAEEIKSDRRNSPNFPYWETGEVLLELDAVSEAISFNQKAIYNKIQKVKPEFVNHYWGQGKLQGPNFLIIGVMKCGTTAFYDYLVKHPQILPAIIKEPGAIGLAQTNNKLKKNLDYYLSLFPPIPSASNFVTGEASTLYIWNQEAANNVLNYFPNTKLIVILRNPVKRVISQYQHFLIKKNLNRENRNLEETIILELEELSEITEPAQLIEKMTAKNYLRHSLYVYFLEKWMKIFPREQFLILRSEDLSRNPAVVMKQTYEFLGLPNYQHIEYPRINKGTYTYNIDEGLISRLYGFYRPHNQRLEEFLGQKFNWE